MGQPNFLILGCQKGGTTSLYDLVVQHPQVATAAEKELQFFSLHYARGWDWYQRQFPKGQRWLRRLRSGEATPYYLFHPLAAERIARHCPRVRLVVLLRDPVERALSQYFHSVRLGLEHLELAEALAAEPQRLTNAEAALGRGERHQSHQEHSYVSRSRYGPQLERYARLFPGEQLLVLRSETFFFNPQAVTDQVWRFLGLKPHPLTTLRPANQGRGEAAGVSPATRGQLEELLAGERSVMEHWLARQGPHGQPA
jgi:hypothetical protein